MKRYRDIAGDGGSAVLEQVGERHRATVAALAGQVVLSLVPVNDGDDLHYVFVDPELIPQLKKLLGSDYTTAFEELPAAPIERAAKR